MKVFRRKLTFEKLKVCFQVLMCGNVYPDIYIYMKWMAIFEIEWASYEYVSATSERR